MNAIRRYFVMKTFAEQIFPLVVYPTLPKVSDIQNENTRKLGYLISLRYGTELTPKTA